MRHPSTARSAAACLALAAAVCAASPRTARWDSEAEKPAPHVADAFRGDTIHLEPRLLSYGSPLDISNAVINLYWQTNGMGSAWWSKPAAPAGGAGRIRAVFAPTNDYGAPRYTFFIHAASADGGSYSAHGVVRLAPSPGYSPTAAPPAGQAWVSPDELHAVSNALAGAVQAEALLRVAGDDAVGNRAAEVRSELLATNAAITASLPLLTVAEARRLVATDSNAWITVENGTNWLYTVVDGDDIYVSAVAEYSGDPLSDGPPIGTLWQRKPGGGWAAADGWLLYYVGEGFASWYIQADWKLLSVAGPPEVLPVTLQPTAPTVGSPTIDWAPVTNRYQIATQTGTVILISEHDEDPEAHADIRGALAAIPTTFVGGTTYPDLGSNIVATIIISNQLVSLWKVIP